MGKKGFLMKGNKHQFIFTSPAILEKYDNKKIRDTQEKYVAVNSLTLITII